MDRKDDVGLNGMNGYEGTETNTTGETDSVYGKSKGNKETV